MCRIIICMVTTLSLGFSVFAEEDVLARKNSTLKRLKPDNLAATHSDVMAIQASRTPLDEMQKIHTQLGVSDFKGIFHAHAGDSAHTGGTPEELLVGAKQTGLEVVFLSDHFRPPQDFMNSWRGLKDGVLFVPGSEAHGFLVHPDKSVFEEMSGSKDELIKAVDQGTGMLFLSHVESKIDHSMDGVMGMEIYNRHYDAMDDLMLMVMNLATRMTTPEGANKLKELVQQYPDEVFAAQYDYPQVYMDKWDAETQHKRIVGVGANDCHHNNVLTLKMKDNKTGIFGTNVDPDDEMHELPLKTFPGLKHYFGAHQPGDTLATVDIDPYPVAIQNVSTHILAKELDEPTIRKAVKSGHAYVSHDWLCDPKGFMLWVQKKSNTLGIMGDEIPYQKKLRIRAQLPLKTYVRLIRNGKVIDEAETDSYSFKIKEPGVYRLEAWLKVNGEMLGWIYANPVYIR